MGMVLTLAIDRLGLGRVPGTVAASEGRAAAAT